MIMQKSTKFIWINGLETKNSYGEFFDTFTLNNTHSTVNISVDGDYTLYINGEYAASSQYGDFEHYKIYDQIDISEYVRVGENSISILVWHFGENTSRYKKYKAGLAFEVLENDKIVISGSERTLSRKSLAYKSGEGKMITCQLGFSYSYDATKEDDFINGNLIGFAPSVIVNKECIFYKRPIKKHTLKNVAYGKIISKNDEGTNYIFDLGREYVGYLTFMLRTEKENNIIISYGEHLENGHVKRHIDSRDFSVEYYAKKGENSFANYMLRFACRYIELSTQSDVNIDKIGIIPQSYEPRPVPRQFENELDKKIYDACLNTLELCMMEHYVDCPWREQCLYAFDSRNQMLAGYMAYENGNADYARANLLLMSKDRRSDGLLSICFPSGINLTIPSFSLHYIIALFEYLDFTGDKALIYEVDFKIREILDTFLKKEKDGVITAFEGEEHWNFFDWSDGLEGSLGKSIGARKDVMLSLLTAYALDSYEKICEKCTLTFMYDKKSSELKKKIKEHFFNKEDGLISLLCEEKIYHTLPNALAILLDVVTKDEAEVIAEKITSERLTAPSLSMRVFEYDALLKVSDKYKDYIKKQIHSMYGKMLSQGSTTVWETENGSEDFEGAGSLCHGWSAIVIKYLI